MPKHHGLARLFNKDTALNVYLPLIPASVVVHETLTFVLLGLLFLSNPTYFRVDETAPVRRWCEWLLIGILTYQTVIVLNGIFLVGTDPGLIFERGHRLFVALCLAPILFDYVYCTAKEARFDADRMFRNFHLALLVFTLGKVAYVLYGWGPAIGRIDSIRDVLGPRAGMFASSPHYHDNYAATVILASIWTSLYAMMCAGDRLRWLPVLAPVMVAGFFSVTIFFSGNLGGWLGLVAAALFVVLLLFYLGIRKPVLALLLVALMGGAVFHDPLERAVAKHWATVADYYQEGSNGQAQSGGTPFSTLDLANRCADGSVEMDDLTIIPNRSVYLRMEIYAFSLNVWSHRPLLGYGVYDRDYLNARFSSRDRCVSLHMSHPHNTFLNQAIIGGVFQVMLVSGLLLFPVGLLFLNLPATSREFPLLVPVAVYSIYFFVDNVFDTNFESLDFAALTTPVLFTAAAFVILKGSQDRVSQSDVSAK